MITLFYSCKHCGLVERPVQVPAREAEDVAVWVKQVVAKVIGDDHVTVSPGCNANSITHLKIPMPKDAQFIGQQVE